MQVKLKTALQPIPMLSCLPPFSLAFITDTLFLNKSTFKANQNPRKGRLAVAETYSQPGRPKPRYQKVLCPKRSRAIASQALHPVWDVLSFPKTLGHWTKHLELGKEIAFIPTLSQANHDTRPPFHRSLLQFQTKPHDFY